MRGVVSQEGIELSRCESPSLVIVVFRGKLVLVPGGIGLRAGGVGRQSRQDQQQYNSSCVHPCTCPRSE